MKMDWDEDLPLNPEEEYQSLINALQWKRGFGLFFVCCAKEDESKLVQRIREDIPDKKIEELRLDKAIDNLYNPVKELLQTKEIDILLIQGIEYSLYRYELQTFGKISETRFDTYTDIPAILNHLNQQRERFRDDLPISYVFFVRIFALKYFIRRAPDFFDWRSGEWEFPLEYNIAASKTLQIGLEGDFFKFYKYAKLSPSEKSAQIIEIQNLISADTLEDSRKNDLFSELGVLLTVTKDYTDALSTFEQLLTRQSDHDNAWFYKGFIFADLGNSEEAIASYDRALEFKPDLHEAWYNRGNALRNLGRDEEAIASFDRALKIKPDYHETWYNRGIALRNLGRDEEAIASYDRALEIKPDYHEAWYNRGIALGKLGRYEEAISSYNRALDIKPDYHEAWNNRGIALRNLGRYEEAIASYDRALEIKPDKHEAWNNRGIALRNLGRNEEAISSYDRALKIKPDDHQAWKNRGVALKYLGRNE